MKRASHIRGMDSNFLPQIDDFESILTHAKAAAHAMKDPNFMRNWNEFRLYVHERFNFSNKFSDIVRETLRSEHNYTASPSSSRS